MCPLTRGDGGRDAGRREMLPPVLAGRKREDRRERRLAVLDWLAAKAKADSVGGGQRDALLASQPDPPESETA